VHKSKTTIKTIFIDCFKYSADLIGFTEIHSILITSNHLRISNLTSITIKSKDNLVNVLYLIGTVQTGFDVTTSRLQNQGVQRVYCNTTDHCVYTICGADRYSKLPGNNLDFATGPEWRKNRSPVHMEI